jgi:ketosteroid isomerase-like protein
MPTTLERLSEAVNSHDGERMATLFAEDYASSQPVHPGRGFGGRAQVAKNWTALFEAVLDFTADTSTPPYEGSPSSPDSNR